MSSVRQAEVSLPLRQVTVWLGPALLTLMRCIDLTTDAIFVVKCYAQLSVVALSH